MLPQYGRARGGLHFRVFGFPVRVDPFFFFIVVALGFSTHATVGGMVAWFAVVFVSILIHELGHAFAARAVGSDSIGIELQSMGGLTAYRPRRSLSRLEQIGVSLAGPFSGFALGTAALVLANILDVSTTRSGDNVVLFDLLWVNFGWGLFNLLPVLPLDGGIVMQNLLPGNEAVRGRRAAMVSLAILVVAAVISIRMNFFFGVIYAGLLGAFNFSALTRGSGAPCPQRRRRHGGRSVRSIGSRRSDRASRRWASSPVTRRPPSAQRREVARCRVACPPRTYTRSAGRAQLVPGPDRTQPLRVGRHRRRCAPRSRHARRATVTFSRRRRRRATRSSGGC